MKYYNITVNGVAYSVSVEETAAGAALPVPSVSRLPCPATFWMSRSLPAHP